MKRWKAQLKNWPLVADANAIIKARHVERAAAESYRYHQAEAERRNLKAFYGTELERAVRSRVADRARRLGWPKKQRQLHIFVTFCAHNWETILATAFAPFGETTIFEWSSHGFCVGLSDWLDRRDSMNAAMLKAFHTANKRRPVDVVVGYFSGMTISPETLDEMARAGAVITNFSFDDKQPFPGKPIAGRYPTNAAIAGSVDLNLTSDPRGIVKYAVYGGLAMFHPEAADPDLHRHHSTPFEFDVSFIGANYGWRGKFVRALIAKGINIACFGPGWPSGPLPNEELSKVYSKSRINLGFGGIGYSRNLVNLKGRDFEVTMSGGLYLTQYNPELNLVYELGKEIVTYRDEEDCARIIRELIANPELAAKIREAGQKRAHKDHTYEMRWKNVLRVLGALD